MLFGHPFSIKFCELTFGTLLVPIGSLSLHFWIIFYVFRASNRELWSELCRTWPHPPSKWIQQLCRTSAKHQFICIFGLVLAPAAENIWTFIHSRAILYNCFKSVQGRTTLITSMLFSHGSFKSDQGRTIPTIFYAIWYNIFSNPKKIQSYTILPMPCCTNIFQIRPR